MSFKVKRGCEGGKDIEYKEYKRLKRCNECKGCKEVKKRVQRGKELIWSVRRLESV